jgi:uncharacterized protein YbbC (DUF1343 family)
MGFMRKTLPGADVICHWHDDSTLKWLREQRVGLVTNHTGRLIDGTPLLHALRVLDIPVVAMFSPEHGPQGTQEGDVESGRTGEGLPIHSLYGATKRPTDAMLQGIEALVFDIQDVGARFYTTRRRWRIAWRNVPRATFPCWCSIAPTH